MTSSITVNLFVHVKLETTTNGENEFLRQSILLQPHSRIIINTSDRQTNSTIQEYMYFFFTFTTLNIKGFLVDKKIKKTYFFQEYKAHIQASV
jgi:hypothetical protein